MYKVFMETTNIQGKQIKLWVNVLNKKNECGDWDCM